ncbi:AAA domain-containing protein [Spirosoma oryzicola]|uniref:AAA domain-containing protein n=1 Tax=Spirosoma oryzicola TaxID=2898794 RepID=UPI001E411379|nr:AAA domain-containing protein [Spirosoma oryzicola]UHG91112.1 AAA domain-containing protein [Spirosoma oryzicola]
MPYRSDILRAFRRRLVNLSSRNRSLLLTNLPASQFLDLHEADFLVNSSSFNLISELISRKSSLTISEVLDARHERSNEVSRKLRRIARTAKFITEERGTEDLYVGWPFVRGKFMDGTVVHAPLLFFPIQIEQQGKYWKLVRRSDEFAFLNPTFVLAYGQYNQVRIPDEILEKTLDDFDQDALVFRTQLYEWLKAGPIEINFNQNLFVDTLHFFDPQTAKSLHQLERTGELKLYPEAVLGIFPQAGSYLVPDYDKLLAERQQPESAELLDLFPTLPENSSLALPENRIHTPLPLDASQESALRAVKSGQSLVVQGPPGTGKSQLIANLMADAAAAGKRVLLVCQKRAALDVVQARLKQVGMGPFVALIHDFQDDRRALYAQIANQIEQIGAYRKQNTSLNAVLLERNFDQESRRIDEAVSELRAFKEALFSTSECGVSAKELYLTTSPNAPSIPLGDSYPHFHTNNMDNFTRRLSAYADYKHRLSPSHPWASRRSFAEFTLFDLPKADQAIAKWTEAVLKAHVQAVNLVDKPLTLDQLANWQANDPEISALLTTLDEANRSDFWPIIQYLRNKPKHPAFTVNQDQLESLANEWEAILALPGPEMTVSLNDLSSFDQLLVEALQAHSSWVRWNWWQLTNEGKIQLKQVASSNNLTVSQADIKILRSKVAKRVSLEVLKSRISPLLADLPLAETPDSLHILRRAIGFIERSNAIISLSQLPTSTWLTAARFQETVKELLVIARSVERERTLAQTYLSETQLVTIWRNDNEAVQLRQSLRQDFDLLVEADRLNESFSTIEKSVIERLITIDPSHWVKTFMNSLGLAWIDHLERKYPELRSVSSLKMAQTEEDLQQSVLRKQALSRDILLVKLRDQTYRNLTFNRLNNVVTYRDLLHQTTKKRTIWPVRKLMESFADEVFKLIPCWLASPESVSAMFPLQAGLFDLVIFDEASQCFAENGIPAIFRAKQVVITGDSQQLRPNDLYRTQVDDIEISSETIAPSLEVESLLELAVQELPQISLTEHYRSRSLDLITFSNVHFYQNKLQLLPYFSTVNRHEPAIRYKNVEGVWKQNTNQIEAEAIVQLIGQLMAESPELSIGVVTFNYPQQQLIQELLEAGSEAIISQFESKVTNERLIVKNIENIQGDERDIIIFSTGYAPDERGKLSMQFGSLSAQGGANRLNVAVTRARERIYVITSLWPNQMNIADVTNDGPKLLKAYLDYALTVSEERFKPAYQVYPSPLINTLLRDQLIVQHPNWQPELPFADLTVKDETDGNYEAVVLTDDNAYYQQSLKQSHAYLPIALRSRNWPFQRFWSRTFWQKAIN